MAPKGFSNTQEFQMQLIEELTVIKTHGDVHTRELALLREQISSGDICKVGAAHDEAIKRIDREQKEQWKDIAEAKHPVRRVVLFGSLSVASITAIFEGIKMLWPVITGSHP